MTGFTSINKMNFGQDHWLQLSLETGELDRQTLADALQQGANQAQRAGEIIRRIRNFVASGAPERARTDLADLIQEVLTLVAPARFADPVALRVMAPALPDPLVLVVTVPPVRANVGVVIAI